MTLLVCCPISVSPSMVPMSPRRKMVGVSLWDVTAHGNEAAAEGGLEAAIVVKVNTRGRIYNVMHERSVKN